MKEKIKDYIKVKNSEIDINNMIITTEDKLLEKLE